MTTRDLIYFVLFIASSCYSVFMYFLTLTDHVFITSEIPIHYTPIEAKVYVALTISTTFTFVITILLSEKSIIYNNFYFRDCLDALRIRNDQNLLSISR